MGNTFEMSYKESCIALLIQKSQRCGSGKLHLMKWKGATKTYYSEKQRRQTDLTRKTSLWFSFQLRTSKYKWAYWVENICRTYLSLSFQLWITIRCVSTFYFTSLSLYNRRRWSWTRTTWWTDVRRSALSPDISSVQHALHLIFCNQKNILNQFKNKLFLSRLHKNNSNK